MMIAAIVAALLPTMPTHAGESEPMPNLPLARGRSFADLDSYLAYRAELGKSDQPYYLLVGPELYQLIRGRATQTRPPDYYTRQQLLEQFGFER